MNTRQQVVILSAELANKRFESNRQRTLNLKACLDDCNMRYKPAKGVYKGQAEDSFVVVLRDNAELETLKDFAFKCFNQESILYQDANGEAYLIYQDGKTEQLGRLEQVSEELARKNDSYTEMDGRFYITVSR